MLKIDRARVVRREKWTVESQIDEINQETREERFEVKSLPLFVFPSKTHQKPMKIRALSMLKQKSSEEISE